MTAQNSGSMEEIEFHPDAVSVSEYSWYSHPRCSWVREFDELIQTFKKDQGLKCISIDNLMGLVLLNIADHLRKQGFIPDSLPQEKIDKLIPELLNRKKGSAFDVVAEKEFWYYADLLMNEFGQTELDPSFMFIGLLMMKNENHYMDFFESNGIDRRFVIGVAIEVFEDKVPDQDGNSADDPRDGQSGTCREIVCTKCGEKFEHIDYGLVDCENNPAAVKAIENSTLNQIICPHCKACLGATVAACLNRTEKWIIVFDPQHSISEDSLTEISSSFDNFSEYKARIVYDNTSLLETYMCLNFNIDQRIVESLRHVKAADGTWEKPMYFVDIDRENQSLCFIPAGETKGVALTCKEITEILSSPAWVELPTGKFLTPEDISMSVEVGEIFIAAAKGKSEVVPVSVSENPISNAAAPPQLLSELMRQAGLNPARCKLVRHSGTSKELLACLNNPAFFDAYQASQSRPVFDNCDYILIFIGESGTSARFLGCCQVNGRKELSRDLMPEGYPYPEDFMKADIFYDLNWTDLLKEYWNKLTIDWGKGTVAWCQNATNEKNIISLNDATGTSVLTSDEATQKVCRGKESFEKAKRLLATAKESESQAQVWNLFAESFYQGYPDEALNAEAQNLGSEFQYLLARFYLNWDYRRINFKLAMKYAKMAADGGRRHAAELYQTIMEQLQ